MDFNPLSLLEVTMPIEEDDNECMIIEDSPPPSVVTVSDEPEIYRDSEPLVMMKEDPLAMETIVNHVEEPEIYSGAGVHFLQQEDPLAMPSPSPNNTCTPADFVAKNAVNLFTVSPEEFAYRNSYYKDVQDVLLEMLHCTICQDHVGCDIRVGAHATEHPLLKVLVCEKCASAYKMLQFPLSKGGKDIRCRWCGKLPGRSHGFVLRYCQQCPFGFCELCLFRNAPGFKKSEPWVCFGCEPRSIWAPRCVLWALQKLKSQLLSTPSISSIQDYSHCSQTCKKTKGKSKTAENKVRKGTSKPQVKNVLHLKKVLQLKKGETIVLNRVNTNGQYGKQLRKALIEGNQVTLNGSLAQSPSAVVSQLPTAEPTPNNYNLNNEIPFPPSLLPVVDNRLKMNTSWFCQKVENYEKDVLNLATKLKKIREDSLMEDTIQSITNRIETVTTLLSLNSSLLKDCGINLMHEWKEKRSRFEIDNINVNFTLPSIDQKSNNSASTTSQVITVTNIPPSTGTKSVKKNGPSKLVLRKQQNGTFSFKICQNETECIDLEVESLIEQFNIKPCSVRISRISKKIIDQIKRRGSYRLTGRIK